MSAFRCGERVFILFCIVTGWLYLNSIQQISQIPAPAFGQEKIPWDEKGVSSLQEKDVMIDVGGIVPEKMLAHNISGKGGKI
ncbi:hypothetical protein Y032_0018g3636 [Ancylostoma ceylanicum]|uniref:Uncharacterized protein n=1 Tax=Ancylostoma ceylanicum TaxID=53326 RepID=A0A016V3E4_9BILA|nr:hypothetical protein Y032_0018g3636 [Ancylostoma ceylanicum]